MCSSVKWPNYGCVFGILAALFIATASWAQQPSSQLTSSEFQAEPTKILRDNPVGGSALSSEVRSLALADKANLPLIIGQLANGTPNQRSAIGSGLALAALASVTRDREYANEIQRALAAVNDDVASAAYAAVLGDLSTAAASTGAAGGGGAGQVSQTLGPGLVAGATQTTGPNASPNTGILTFSGTTSAAVGSPGGSASLGTTSASNPASP